MGTKYQDGIALLESLVALLIFSMGILAVAGLQGFMIKGASEAKNRADASLIAQSRVAMMWANPVNLAGFIEAAPGTPVPELPSGFRTTAVTVATGAVTVTVTWTTPGEATHNYSANARVVGAI